MAYLIDTRLLARLADSADVYHAVALRAVVELHRRGEVLHVTPQNLVEFRNATTPPTTLNGLGLAAVDAEAKAAVFEATFPLPFWRRRRTFSQHGRPWWVRSPWWAGRSMMLAWSPFATSTG